LTDFPVINTVWSEWSAGFPPGDPDTASLPQAWVDALDEAVNADKIPDVPVSTSISGSDPVYPTGYDPMSPAVCSSTYRCITPGDLWDAPEGVIGLGFDDGPLPVRAIHESDRLLF